MCACVYTQAGWMEKKSIAPSQISIYAQNTYKLYLFFSKWRSLSHDFFFLMQSSLKTVRPFFCHNIYVFIMDEMNEILCETCCSNSFCHFILGLYELIESWKREPENWIFMLVLSSVLCTAKDDSEDVLCVLGLRKWYGRYLRPAFDGQFLFARVRKFHTEYILSVFFSKGAWFHCINNILWDFNMIFIFYCYSRCVILIVRKLDESRIERSGQSLISNFVLILLWWVWSHGYNISLIQW